MNLIKRMFNKPETNQLLDKLKRYRTEANENFEAYRRLYNKCYKWWMNEQKPESLPLYNSDAKYNLLQVATQTKLPILVQDDPTIAFIPYEPEKEVNARKLTKIVGSYIWNREKALQKYSVAAQDAMVYGTGWWKIFFDPSKVVNGKQMGDVAIVSVDPYAIREDPLAPTIEDARYVIHLAYIPLETAKIMYPEHENEIVSNLS